MQVTVEQFISYLQTLNPKAIVKVLNEVPCEDETITSRDDLDFNKIEVFEDDIYIGDSDSK